MARKSVDWDAIEPIYRAGIRTLRDIASEYGITEGAIRKRAATFDWSRDLSAQIKLKAEDLVRKSEVRSEVRKTDAYRLTERDIINANAENQAAVLLTERADIKRLSGISDALETELESYSEELEKKANILKKLVETRKTIIELRRRNYNITDNSNGDAPQPLPIMDDKTLAAKLSGLFALAQARNDG